MLVKQIFYQRKRNTLTILSMICSMMLVLIVVTLSNSIKISLAKQIESMGLDVTMIQNVSGKDDTIEINDLKNSSKLFSRYYQFVDDNKNVYGIDSSFFEMFSFKLKDGTYFDISDDLANNNVVILGSNAYKDCNYPSINEIIYINSIAFRVKGILESSSQVLLNTDDSYFIPADYVDNTASMSYLLNEQEYDVLLDENEFFTIDQRKLRKQFSSVITFISDLLSGLSAFSVVVSFIGYINSSLSNVKIRQKEIALKKALGANDRQIFMEFMIESLILVSFSIVCAIVLSLLIIKVFDKTIQMNSYYVIGFGTLNMFVGLLCGLIPAYLAKKTSIIDSLIE